jgi:hypothetical protein
VIKEQTSPQQQMGFDVSSLGTKGFEIKTLNSGNKVAKKKTSQPGLLINIYGGEPNTNKNRIQIMVTTDFYKKNQNLFTSVGNFGITLDDVSDLGPIGGITYNLGDDTDVNSNSINQFVDLFTTIK